MTQMRGYNKELQDQIKIYEHQIEQIQKEVEGVASQNEQQNSKITKMREKKKNLKQEV